MSKPERHFDESPVEYYKRVKCCPDDFYKKFEGKFYCNPAHCSATFDNSVDRDKHLEWAYSILG